MNLYVNDGTRPNPTKKLTPVNTMANMGYKPSQGGIPDFIPLDAGLLIENETDKYPSREDLRLFDIAFNPDITNVMKPCKSNATVDIIDGRIKRREPRKDTKGMYPVAYAGGRNQPIGLAQEREQIIAKNMNEWDSNYPNMKTPIGKYPNP
jgi:hypothetical protein